MCSTTGKVATNRSGFGFGRDDSYNTWKSGEQLKSSFLGARLPELGGTSSFQLALGAVDTATRKPSLEPVQHPTRLLNGERFSAQVLWAKLLFKRTVFCAAIP